MIEPFLQYWTPQIVWLMICWSVLFALLKWSLVPRFFALQKKRAQALKRLHSEREKIEQKILEKEEEVLKKEREILHNIRQVVEEARTQSTKETQTFTDALNQELREHNQKKEYEYEQLCKQADASIQDYPWADLVQRFMEKMKDSHV
ncbi:MAG: hypothetical protein OXC30_05950 [Alphaproteobacteria bacterium]|nr:hypothetical protein [Alphaproteobacteria bacterium]